MTDSDESEKSEVPSTEKIVEEAVAFYDDLDSLYVVLRRIEGEENHHEQQEKIV